MRSWQGKWLKFLAFILVFGAARLFAQQIFGKKSTKLTGFDGSCSLSVYDRTNSGTKSKTIEYHTAMAAEAIELLGFKGGAARTNINGVDKPESLTLELSYKGAVTMVNASDPIKDKIELFLNNADGSAALTCRSRQSDGNVNSRSSN